MKNTELNNNSIKIIPLRAINERWTINLIHDFSEKPKIIQEKPLHLNFTANFNDIDYKKCIELWLKKYAKESLIPWIENISEQTGLRYQHVSIRAQRTRWGSCSENKMISLNYKLMFLPAKLVQHLLLHELCHTVHLDHSENFWQLLANHDKHWLETKQHCRKAHHYIPSWLEK